MGLDVYFQAIPNNQEILELAQTDDDWLDILASPFSTFQSTRLRNSLLKIPEQQEKLEKFDSMFVRFLRTFALCTLWGRKWDVLAYLLIEKRRNCRQVDEKYNFYKIEDMSVFDDRDRLLYRAMFGGDLMRQTKAVGSRNGQTEIPRYISSDEVSAIVGILYQISFDDLLEHYSDVAMDKAILYKFHPYQDSNKDSIIEAFVLLRDFYANVSSYNAGLLWKMI